MNREMRDWLKVRAQMKGEPQPTPGPWIDKGEYDSDRIVGADDTRVIYLDDDGACGDPECCGPPSYRIVINAVDLPLILAAPSLAAEVGRLREALRTLIAASYEDGDTLIAARNAARIEVADKGETK